METLIYSIFCRHTDESRYPVGLIHYLRSRPLDFVRCASLKWLDTDFRRYDDFNKSVSP
jgi:hypothetical protein